jgi:hypothetical protein
MEVRSFSYATCSDFWTPEEDEKLTTAIANTHKKEWRKELKTDWAAVSALVPSRTRNQCIMRWERALNPSVARTAGRAVPWTEDEDNKLKDLVQMHGGKDWAAIAALVPGRTQIQCARRRHAFLKLITKQGTARSNWWTTDEDNKLKYLVQIHGSKDWAAMATLVPGRTKSQCTSRWYYFSKVSTDPATVHNRWTVDEDNKLKDLVQMHGGKDWAAITALVPDRTQHQCSRRWHTFLKLSAKRATEYLDLWTADEDNKLKDLVQMHGTKHWAAIAALVPGRTTIQCARRWHRFLKIKTERATSRYRWTEEEDSKLKDLVQMHGGKDWAATAALLPGRTVIQCTSRWHRHLNPSIVSCK